MRPALQSDGATVPASLAGSADIARLKSIVQGYFRDGSLAEGVSIVHRRSRGRGVLLRVATAQGHTLVVKAWAATRLGERCKRVAGFSNARREWRMHQRLYAAGLPMPAPIAYRLWSGDATIYEMLVVEDLGKLERSLECLKASLHKGDEKQVRWIEDTVINMTTLMCASGVTDLDHQLNNIVMTSDGRLVRLDVECAIYWRLRKVSEKAAGEMIGSLVITHAFACQPQMTATVEFARRLAHSVGASPTVLRHAKSRVDSAMARQRETYGIDTQVPLYW